MASSPKRARPIESEDNPPPSMIGKIGDDLLTEILIRLPNPRSASRCKAVCKGWNSLISDHRFGRRFVSHNQALFQPETLLLHTNDAGDLQSVIMSFMPPMPERVLECFKVLDCCKDLVLCGFADFIGLNKEIGRSYVVCNPFTKQWMALPLAPEKAEGYEMPVAKLVCEPLGSSKCSYNLDLGDDQVYAYSEFRFRVVCIYQHDTSIKLDVFCPESGNWTKEAVVYDGFCRPRPGNVCACNGKLFWWCFEAEAECGSEELNVDSETHHVPEFNPPLLGVFDPFRFDIHTTRVEAFEYTEGLNFDISVSQGALHIIELHKNSTHACIRLWRLDDDHKSWRDLSGMCLVRPPKCGYEIWPCKFLDLHPEEPEVIFFEYLSPSVINDAILCCDLRVGELEFFTDLRLLTPRWSVFQPRISCWPTPIPRYEKLRDLYDGSCSWLKAAKDNNSLNSGSEKKAAAPPITTAAAMDVLCDATDTLMRDATFKIGVRRDLWKTIASVNEMQKLNHELDELERQRKEMLSCEVGQG